MPVESKHAGVKAMRAARRHQRRLRRHERILRATSAPPTLVTVLNGLCGFASIYFATKGELGQANMHNLFLAAGLIFLAMGFDMLDGWLARRTQNASSFGAQLDSLCDVISFGVAPPILMLQTVALIVRHEHEYIAAVDRVVWSVAALYVACAVLRLARFNVETESDEAHHLTFKGLPSPAAAAVVAASVLLYHRLRVHYEIGLSALADVFAIILPLVTLTAALLMVSTFIYPHLVTRYLRGKRTFFHLVKIVLVVFVVGLVEPYVSLAAGTLIYMLAGPAHWLRHRHNSPPGTLPMTRA